MPDPVTAPQPARASPTVIQGLRCRVRVAGGRMFSGDLPPERHRALQLGLLHADSEGLIELAAGIRRNGRLQITTRKRADHFLPGGAAREPRWMAALLALAARHADRGEEVFIAPAVRAAPRGEKHAVAHTRALPAKRLGRRLAPRRFRNVGGSWFWRGVGPAVEQVARLGFVVRRKRAFSARSAPQALGTGELDDAGLW